MAVKVIKNGGVIVSSDPEWKSYTENRLDPEATIEQIPTMIFPATDKQPSATKIVRHLLWINKIQVVKGFIYLYDESKGMYEKLERNQEWLKLNKFFHPRVQQMIGSGTAHEALSRIKSIPSVQLDENLLNGDPYLINVSNGVLNLQVLELEEKSFSHYFTYQINANFSRSKGWEDCAYFDNFCKTSLQGDEAKIKLLLQILGYLCSKLWGAKKAFFLVGAPNCGKSVILDLLKFILGENNVSSIPLHKLGDRFSLANLVDKAVNICAEIKAFPLRGIDTFKGIVSGDTLMGEQKGETAFSFKCRTKLLFAGNTFPEIAEVESGQAFIERLCFLLFPVSIPKEKQDQQLLEHLLSERDAIFSLAIRTLPELIQQNMLFVTCPESINFLENISEQQSHVKRFIDECCQRRPGCRISTLSLYTEYQEFCKQNCFKAYAVTQFSEIVRNIAQVDSCRFRDGGNPVRGFSGLTLQEPYLTRHGTAQLGN